MPSKRVLLVEDEQSLSEIILKMIEAFGLDGTGAESAKMARSKLDEERFDLLIIDLTLPDMPGIELYKAIVEEKPEYRGKVVFTSGFTPDEELEELLEKENITFLPKPFPINKFKEIIENY